MSLTHRPPVVINGIRRMRTFHYFWCQQVPPCCQLRYELDTLRPRLAVDHLDGGLEPSPGARLLDAMALILDPSIRPRRNNEFDRRARWESEVEIGPIPRSVPRSWISLNFVRQPQRENLVPRADRRSAFSVGHELIEMVRGLTQQNDQPMGPPPASHSAVEALPIGETHAESFDQ
ncbi:hypothetical protein L1049_014486 [Liquidambar formosana]|uniref:Uncharacterized protein n=1 Tax=Liquidambar formosana TaxID=63359 RepID=A0AAP0X1V1_LIQFO